MATVFYARDGSPPDNTSDEREIPLSQIAVAFANAKASWSPHSSSVNVNDPANRVADYRHVVLHVEDDEVAGQFDKPGYWLLHNVTPNDFESKFPSK